ncbi:MAG: PfkB family carbohydrate kinase [Anaerolineales bacterium]|jgi:sugar/nucleoside kinase (ribokinase family)
MSRQPDDRPPEYLILGHITRDILDSGYRLGGTAVYGAVTAKRMGARVALLTSGTEDLDLAGLEDIQILNQPGAGTTTFTNEYTPSGRVQTLSDRAVDLDPDLLPPAWRKAKVVHLAPVACEVPFSAGEVLPNAYLAYSLQGWMRNWDQAGRVSPAPLPASPVPAGLQVVAFLSIEDLGFDREELGQITSRFPTLFLTLGSQGAELHQGGSVEKIAPVPAQEVDPTGAGDIFAAALMVAWQIQGRPLQQAARLASALAAASVEGKGLLGVPSEQQIKALSEVYG